MVKTTARPRFDSYYEKATGLPKPYGSKTPLEPRSVSAQQGRFVRKPRELVVDWWIYDIFLLFVLR